MINIHFIINPISGDGNNELSLEFLNDSFNCDSYAIHIKYSRYKKHAIDLANKSKAEGAQIIVACGGDGTINEIASTLVGTQIPLGIIPIGSGNGLASTLCIPKNISDAITVIKNYKPIKIDVGLVNGTYFFSNTGFGFDANVIENYEASVGRSLFAYMKASFKSYRNLHNQGEIEIMINDTTKIVNPFLIFISNSNEMGYSLSLTPKASLQDGLLDVVIVSKISRLKILLFGLLMLIKKQNLLREVKTFQIKDMTLKRTKGIIFQSQIDGELLRLKEDVAEVGLVERALVVLT